MKRIICVLAFLLAWTVGFGQEMNFVNELAEKKAVSFGDAVTMYIYTLGKVPAGFNADVRTLRAMNLLKAERYDKDTPLRRGMLALMVARHLRLKGSLFYLMFDTRRYAHRACVAGKIMDATTSEFDKISGDELLEVMAIVSDRMEEKK